jgi:hypothetical protein
MVAMYIEAIICKANWLSGHHFSKGILQTIYLLLPSVGELRLLLSGCLPVYIKKYYLTLKAQDFEIAF